MNNKYYGKLIFELSRQGRVGYSLPNFKYEDAYKMNLPEEQKRQSATLLPEADELTVVRHYTNMLIILTFWGYDGGKNTHYPLHRGIKIVLQGLQK